MAEDGEISDTYKVVMMGISSLVNAHLIEIYDSKDRAWRIAKQVPRENAIMMGRGTQMVFCEGYMYCLMRSTDDDWNVMGFNFREGTSFSTPLPEMADGQKTYPYLLACGSRLLVSRGIVKEGIFNEGEKLLQDFIIWEFEKEKLKVESSSSGFKEITRMPPVYVPEYPTFIEPEYPFMCCVGVGDRACFVTNDFLVIEVVVYNIGEKTWKSLPSFHLDEETKTWISLSSFYGTGHNVWKGSGMAFEPSPDMKVL